MSTEIHWGVAENIVKYYRRALNSDFEEVSKSITSLWRFNLNHVEYEITTAHQMLILKNKQRFLFRRKDIFLSKSLNLVPLSNNFKKFSNKYYFFIFHINHVVKRS